MNSYPQKVHIDRPKNVSHGGGIVSRFLGLLLLLICAAGLPWKALATPPLSPKGSFGAVSATLLNQESCQSPNGYIDPGETNTVTFTVLNNTGAQLTTLKASLDGCISCALFPISGQQTIGTVASGATFTVTFTFRANGSCGNTLQPGIIFTADQAAGNDELVFKGTNGDNSAKLDFQLGATQLTPYTFSSNDAPITINDTDPTSSSNPYGKASSWPSSVTVSGVPNNSGITAERVQSISVTLKDFSHAWTPDVQLLLVGPNGQAIVLMANAGVNSQSLAPANHVNITFSDGASGQLPSGVGTSPITTGSYTVSDFNPFLVPNAAGVFPGNNFPGVAVSNPSANFVTSLAGFVNYDSVNLGLNPNGSWQLYVQDTTYNGLVGQIAGGWSLTVTTHQIVCCANGQTYPLITTSGDSNVDEDKATPDTSNGGAGPQKINTANIYDIETGAGSLALAATSSNPNIVNASNLYFDTSSVGTASAPALMLKHSETHAYGTTTIGMIVTDPQGHSSKTSFTLTVNFKNHAPSIDVPILDQSLTTGVTSPPLPFTISDVETAAGALVVTWNSENPTILPNNNIILGGSGNNRTLTLIPATSNDKSAFLVDYYVTDGNNATTSASFKVQFNGTLGCPTISPVKDQSVSENSSLQVPFNVRPGSSVAAGQLVVTYSIASNSGDNQNLFSGGAISLSGSDTLRYITFAPNPNQYGTAHITLAVTDPGLQGTSSSCSTVSAPTFLVTVGCVNNAPTITPIQNQAVYSSASGQTTTGSIPFTVNDVETNPASLSVSATVLSSSTPGLVPNDSSHVVLGPANPTSGARTIAIVPQAGLYGNAAIQVTVTDAGDCNGQNIKTASTTFFVTVSAVNQPPTIGNAHIIANQPDGPWNGENPAVSLGGYLTEQSVAASGGLLQIGEDMGANMYDSSNNLLNTHQVNIELLNLGPGANNQYNQTTTIIATSSDTTKIKVIQVTPSSVTGLASSHAVPVLQLSIQPNTYTDPSTPVAITLTLKNNGGVANGGNDTTTVTFNVNMPAYNYAPNFSITANTVVPKNMAVAIPLTLNDTHVVTETALPNIRVAPVPVVPTAAQLAAISGVTEDPAYRVNTSQYDPLYALQNVLVDPANRTITLVLGNIFTSGSSALQYLDQHGGYTLFFTATATDTAVGTGANQAAAKSVTVPFSVTIKDIQPAKLLIENQPGTSSTTVTLNEDNVGLTTLDMSDNVPLSQELDPTVKLSSGCSATTGATYQLSAHSDNQTVLPDSGIMFGYLTTDSTGLNGYRTIAIVPALHQYSSTPINVTITAVNNSCLATTVAFPVVVIGVPHAPTLSLDQGALAAAVSPAHPVSVNEDAATADSSTSSGLLEFDVNNIDGGPANLTLSATSSDTTVVPVANIVFGNTASTGTRRTLTITSGTHQFTKAGVNVTITVTGTVASGISAGLSATQTFYLHVNHVNQPPTVDQYPSPYVIQENAGVQTITLTGVTAGPANEQKNSSSVLDAQGLTVYWYARDKGTGSASDNTVGANTLITGGCCTLFTGSAVDFVHNTATLTITSVANVAGTSTIYYYITDVPTDGTTAASTSVKQFDFQISQIGYPPTVWFNPSTPVTTTTTSVVAGGQTVVPVYVDDPHGDTSGITVQLTATSANQAIVPNSSLTVSGVGHNRGVVIAPPSTSSGGSTAITLSAVNAQGQTATAAITVTVTPNNLPSITGLPTSVTTQIGTPTDLISFNISDPVTPADSLAVTVTSGNTTLVPNTVQNIQFTTTGAKRYLIISPAAGQTGTSTMTVKVTNASGGFSQATFTLLVQGPPPTITKVADQTGVAPGSTVGPLSFQVSDSLTFAGLLTVGGISSNTSLVPNSNILLSGGSGNRTVTLILVSNVVGSTTITLTVTNLSGGTASSSFAVATTTPQPPTISAIQNVTAQVNQSIPLILFTVSDPVTPVGSLQPKATSSNDALISNSSGLFVGSAGGGQRSLLIVPTKGQTGSAIITITVANNAGVSATTSFAVTISSVPLPVITTQPASVSAGVGQSATFVVVATGATGYQWQFNGSNLGGATSATLTLSNVTADQVGSYDVVVSNAGGSVTSAGATLTIAANTPPTISAITNQVVTLGASQVPLITFTVGDAETAPGQLTVTATSSTQALVPSTGIFLGGFGSATRTLLMNLVSGQVGNSVIKVTVKDAGGLTASTSFVVSVVKPATFVLNDFNGDGTPDLVFEDASGNLGIWYMNAESLISGAYLNPSSVGTGWTVVGSGDFAGNNKTDLLLQKTDGTLAIWYMDGGVNLVSAAYLSPSSSGTDYKVVAVADFDKDGKPDILFQKTDGSLAVWYMNNATMTGAAFVTPASPGSASWKVVGAADFNGDGKADILFQNSDGTLAVWYMNGVNLVSGEYLTPANPGADWHVKGITDQNGDGKPDLLLQNSADGSLAIWYMNGSKIVLGKMLNPSHAGGTWQIVAP